jgi:hypothetical protein
MTTRRRTTTRSAPLPVQGGAARARACKGASPVPGVEPTAVVCAVGTCPSVEPTVVRTTPSAVANACLLRLIVMGSVPATPEVPAARSARVARAEVAQARPEAAEPASEEPRRARGGAAASPAATKCAAPTSTAAQVVTERVAPRVRRVAGRYRRNASATRRAIASAGRRLFFAHPEHPRFSVVVGDWHAEISKRRGLPKQMNTRKRWRSNVRIGFSRGDTLAENACRAEVPAALDTMNRGNATRPGALKARRSSRRTSLWEGRTPSTTPSTEPATSSPSPGGPPLGRVTGPRSRQRRIRPG